MPPSNPAIPKEWPTGIVYLRAPHYSKRLSREASDALMLPVSAVPAHEQQLRIPNGPSTHVRITRITDPNHPAHGQYGLFAAQHLPPDSFILPYLGYVHDQNDTNESSDYDLSLDRDHQVGVDASAMGNEARFINDYRGIDAAPCAEFRDIYVHLGNQKAEKRIGVFVLSAGKSGKRAKGIPKGHEILISYGKGFWAARTT